MALALQDLSGLIKEAEKLGNLSGASAGLHRMPYGKRIPRVSDRRAKETVSQ